MSTSGPDYGVQRTALRAAADAERSAAREVFSAWTGDVER
jgi:hypothetical protein